MKKLLLILLLLVGCSENLEHVYEYEEAEAVVLNEAQTEPINTSGSIAGYFIGDALGGQSGGVVGAAVGSQSSRSCEFPIEIDGTKSMYSTSNQLICTTVHRGDTLRVQRKHVTTFVSETQEIRSEYTTPWQILINPD